MSETQSIVVKYELAQPPEKVWRALTEPKLLAAWLMDNDIAPIVGHRFQFRAQPAQAGFRYPSQSHLRRRRGCE